MYYLSCINVHVWLHQPAGMTKGLHHSMSSNLPAGAPQPDCTKLQESIKQTLDDHRTDIMEPLLITTGALALLGVCVSVFVQLRKIKVGAGEAKARVGGLLSDVDNLRHVLQSMEATLDDLEARDLFQNTGHIAWEPDETFYQWMATVADFTTVKPAHVERRQGFESQYLNDATSTVVSLTQPQPSNLQSPIGPLGTMTASNDWTAVPAITMIPASDVQHEDHVTNGHTPSMDQERTLPSPPVRDKELFRAVTVLPDQTDQGTLSIKLSGHTRSSSAPGNLLSTLSLGSPKSEKNRFWKLPRPRSQVNVAELQTGLKVHEPRSSASLSATNIASEESDVFRLVELYSQARCSMNVARIPTPTKKGGKTCVKAVYVGDGACGKTCSLM